MISKGSIAYSVSSRADGGVSVEEKMPSQTGVCDGVIGVRLFVVIDPVLLFRPATGYVPVAANTSDLCLLAAPKR